MATIDEMARALDALIKATGNTSKYAAMQPALMGWKTGIGAWTFDAGGPTGWKYVTLIVGSTRSTVIRAINSAGVADTGDLAIWIDINKSGQPYIYGLRT